MKCQIILSENYSGTFEGIHHVIFDRYVSVQFSYFDDSISGWSDLNPKRKLIMSLKILIDSFGVLIILAIFSELI